jgi:hypothetical protein
MSMVHRIALLGLFALGTLFGARGCGGVTNMAPTRAAARDAATKATCDRYNACGLVGTGQTYTDYSACQIAWEANWDSAWPAADCEGRIDQAQYNVCLSRIQSTSCTNILDFLTTLGICGKANVCVAGADASTG